MKRRATATATVNSVNPYSDGDNWRRRQLAEFLQERSARKQETAASQDLEIEVTLFDELLFKILILLPAQSLFRLQFVCKKWFEIINSSIFIRCHAQQSETVLICRKLTLLEENSKSYFHFMDLDRGVNGFMESSCMELHDILASYDGLILARFGKDMKLTIMNPVTRKRVVLPKVTNNTKPFSSDLESFGIAFSNEAKTYKVVHLFSDKYGCTSCEILCISTMKWRRIEGPPIYSSRDKIGTPVTISDSLCWLKRASCNYVSMNLQDEKFVIKNLPVRTAYLDKLLEIGGSLGFINHAQADLLQVWILINDGGSRESWVKRYSFSLGVDVTYYEPICSSSNGKEIVIASLYKKFELFTYNFDRDEMKLVLSRSDNEARSGWIQKHHIPHRNTLVSCHVPPRATSSKVARKTRCTNKYKYCIMKLNE